MTAFLIYDFKVAVLIAVFYMFYRLLLSKETFHRVNRVVLLATAVLSFVLPLCVITLHETVTLDAVPSVTVGDVRVEVVADEHPVAWQTALFVLFMAGVLVTLGYTLLSVWKVMTLIRRSEQHPQEEGITLCVVDKDVSPFSWMHYIVMSRDDYTTHDAAVLAHERGHIRLRHSVDVLLVDTLTVLQWFNPAMWMLRQDLRAIHEYEADMAVLSQGINMRQYQYLLIQKAVVACGYSVTNGITHSTLKNRINMMLNNNQSTRASWLKLLALLPVVGITLALNAETVTHYVYDEPQQQVPVKKGKKNAKIQTGTVNGIAVVEQAPVTTEPDEQNTAVGTFTPDGQNTAVGTFTPASKENVFDVVEQMPQYPGGPAALIKFLNENVCYPEDAYKNNIQGRVIVTFVVRKDGSISDATVVKSVGPLLDEEALRVVNSMPNWNPGMQNGEPVNVKYTVPISFRLQGADTKEEANQANSSDNTKAEAIYISDAPENLLIIVDGQEVSVEKMKAIDPKTIERMEVLKEKAAVEKYGDKAKNGVIVITMKK